MISAICCGLISYELVLWYHYMKPIMFHDVYSRELHDVEARYKSPSAVQYEVLAISQNISSTPQVKVKMKETMSVAPEVVAINRQMAGSPMPSSVNYAIET